MSTTRIFFDRDGAYLVQQGDIRNRIPMSSALKDKLSPDSLGLVEGNHFVVDGGIAMLPLPSYYMHELKAEIPRAIADAVVYDEVEITRICLNALDVAAARINEARK